MSDHWVIFDDMDTQPGETGNLEVAIDPPVGLSNIGPAVSYTVFATSTNDRRDLVVNTNALGFATSGNLVTTPTHAPILVKGSIAGATSFAMMRHHDGATRSLLAVPNAETALGTSFGVAIGAFGTKSHLLIGNPNAVDAIVTVQYGGSGAAIASTTPVGAQTAGKIQLTSGNAFVCIKSDNPIFVQLVLEQAARFDVTYLLPM